MTYNTVAATSAFWYNGFNMCNKTMCFHNHQSCVICTNINTLFPTETYFIYVGLQVSYNENIFSCSMSSQRLVHKHFLSNFIVMYVSYNCKQNRKISDVSGFISLHSKTLIAFKTHSLWQLMSLILL
jgi:hypothetical protein